MFTIRANGGTASSITIVDVINQSHQGCTQYRWNQYQI